MTWVPKSRVEREEIEIWKKRGTRISHNSIRTIRGFTI